MPRAEILIRATLVTIGVITAGPVLALFYPSMLDWNYGVADPEPMTLALLQHRGMLQLVLGAVLVWAAFYPPTRLFAAAGAILAKSTFLLLILPEPLLRADLAGFSIVFDVICIAFLAILAAREITVRRRHATA